MINSTAHDSIASSVEEIIRLHIGGDDELSPETDLLNDLAIDSLELVEVGLKIEKTFGKKLPIGDLRACVTIGELIDLTRKVNGVAQAEEV
jgi:acyl carrier protein